MSNTADGDFSAMTDSADQYSCWNEREMEEDTF